MDESIVHAIGLQYIIHALIFSSDRNSVEQYDDEVHCWKENNVIPILKYYQSDLPCTIAF